MKVKIVLSIAVLAFAAAAGSASGQIEYAKVNFQLDTAALPTGYLKDSGAVFADRGNGFTYGWDLSATGGTRERNNAASKDKRYDTLNHMQLAAPNGPRFWEIAVPNGQYNLFIVCGDPSNTDQVNTLNVEGIAVPDPDGQDNFDEYTLQGVMVEDGRLTIKAAGTNAKICFIDIFKVDLTFNPAPVVNAGPDQSIYVTESAQLNGTATDEGPQEGDPGVLSHYWYKVSGPGTANFSNSTALDTTVTFTAKGTYELMLQATDGDKDANDVMTIVVKDRADELLVGYWNFDDNVQDQSMNSNHGTIVSLNGGGTYDADAAVGTRAMNLIRVDAEDPNTNYIDLGPATELNFGTGNWTVTGWFKTEQAGTSDEFKGNIFSNGGDNTGGIRYTLGINEAALGAMSVTTDDDITKVQATSTSITNNDGNWHFAAGVRDGSVIRVYVDGVLQGSTNLPANYDLSGASQTNSYIGVGVNFANGPAAVYKHLNGLVDDVRVYNHALALEDEPQYDSILSLTAMGPLLAKVDAGANINFNWKPTLKTQLNGQITDLGRPSETTIVWSTEQGPDDAEAAFDDPGSLDTLVGFPRSGVYTLKLAVRDEGLWVDDTVQVTVNAPTCNNVITDGLLLVTDLDGDCYVGLSDLAILLANWAQCNDPAVVGCDWPF
ncbi:MAG: LamG domain-containing protein [Phycisphaerae bacterium]|nr:LamG domain-containing protein [Phycisphaerae bacterium]